MKQLYQWLNMIEDIELSTVGNALMLMEKCAIVAIIVASRRLLIQVTLHMDCVVIQIIMKETVMAVMIK
jgi:hypothetical protein